VKLDPHFSVWAQPEAVLGSAVRYIASLSPKYQWIGIYCNNGKTRKLGPYMGKKSNQTQSELIIPVTDQNKKILGQIKINSQIQNAFSIKDKEIIQSIADELGKIWPKQKR